MYKYYSASSKPGTFGKTLYSAAFKELGIDAEYTPLGFQTGKEFVEFLNDAKRDLDVKGVSVSMPFKRVAFAHCDEINTPEIENVNTIKIKDGKTIGYNTDYVGFGRARQSLTPHLINGAALYGRGAVAESIEHTCAIFKISCHKIHKNSKLSLKNFHGWDLLVNATPLGMQGVEDDVFTEEVVNKFKYVFDVVVSKQPTNLIKLAKKLEKPHIKGWEMSLEQLCEQFFIYTGQRAPRFLLEDILKEGGYV